MEFVCHCVCRFWGVCFVMLLSFVCHARHVLLFCSFLSGACHVLPFWQLVVMFDVLQTLVFCCSFLFLSCLACARLSETQITKQEHNKPKWQQKICLTAPTVFPHKILIRFMGRSVSMPILMGSLVVSTTPGVAADCFPEQFQDVAADVQTVAFP